MAVSMTKKQRVEYVRKLLLEKDLAVIRGLVCIYQLQTEAEKATDCTKNHNGVGFTAFDAPILSAWAKRALDGERFGPGAINFLRPRVLKYSRQISELARIPSA